MSTVLLHCRTPFIKFGLSAGYHEDEKDVVENSHQ
jgi:hypothetical protein